MAAITANQWRNRAQQWTSALGVWLRHEGLALAVLLVAALIAMAPVLSNPRNEVLGHPGDQLFYIYATGWSAQALLLGESPFVDPRLNYPDDLLLVTNDVPFVMMLLSAPATWALGPVFSYNLIILVAHGLSGLFAYLWVRRLTGSRIGGLVAGLAFMLAPYRMERSLGHLNIVSTQTLPLFFWALDRAISAEQSRERDRWLLGAVTALTGMLSLYHLFIVLICGVFYALARLGRRLWVFLQQGGWRVPVSVLFGTLIGILPAIAALGSGSYSAFSVGRTRIWSADPLNFFMPSPYHPLWGASVWAGRDDPQLGEKILYLGMVSLGLALLGFWAMGKQPRWRALRPAWLAALAAGLIFALGTDLHFDGEPLNRDAPFWLPAYYLAQLPLMGVLRAWARFGEIAILFVALGAGVGAAWLAKTLPRRATPWLAFGLVALLWLDLWPGNLPSFTLEPRPIDRWLAEQPEDFSVAFLPVDKPGINDRAIYGSLFHGKHLPSYAHPQHLPFAYRTFQEAALRLPSAASLATMQTLKIDYLIFEQAEYNGWRAPEWVAIEPELATLPGLTFVTEIDGFAVYRLP